MNPPRSFKFRFKINGMRAHWVRARFRDRSRPCFMHRIRMHATFIQLSRIWSLHSAQDRVASSGRRRVRCLGAVRADHFGAKRWAQLLVEKAPWRGEELQRPLFLPTKRGAWSAEPPFSGRLAYGEGISERNPACFQDWSTSSSFDVGLLRTDRPPLTLSWSSDLRIIS